MGSRQGGRSHLPSPTLQSEGCINLRPIATSNLLLQMVLGRVFISHLFSFPLTSMSFMKHSILSGRSEELALISFLSFSHSWKRRTRARGLDLTSSLYLFPKSSQKWLTRISSKSFPPSSGSKAVARIWWRERIYQDPAAIAVPTRIIK